MHVIFYFGEGGGSSLFERCSRIRIAHVKSHNDSNNKKAMISFFQNCWPEMSLLVVLVRAIDRTPK